MLFLLLLYHALGMFNLFAAGQIMKTGVIPGERMEVMKKRGEILKRAFAVALALAMVLGCVPFSPAALTVRAETITKEQKITIPVLTENGVDKDNGFVVEAKASYDGSSYNATVTLPTAVSAGQSLVGVKKDGNYDVIAEGMINRTFDLSAGIPAYLMENFTTQYDQLLPKLWDPSVTDPTMLYIKNLVWTDMNIKAAVFSNKLGSDSCSIYDTPDQTINVTVQEMEKLVSASEFATASSVEPSGETVSGPNTIPFSISSSDESDKKTFTVNSGTASEGSYSGFESLIRKYTERTEGDPDTTLSTVQVRTDGDTLWMYIPGGLGTPGISGSGAGSINTNALIKVTGLTKGNDNCASEFKTDLETVLAKGIENEDSLLAALALMNKFGGIDSEKVAVTVTFEAVPVAEVTYEDNSTKTFYSIDDAVKEAITNKGSCLELLQECTVTANLQEDQKLTILKNEYYDEDASKITGAEAVGENDTIYCYAGKVENALLLGQVSTPDYKVSLVADAQVEGDVDFHNSSLDLASYTLSASGTSNLTNVGGLTASNGGQLGSGTFIFTAKAEYNGASSTRTVTFKDGVGTTPKLSTDTVQNLNYWKYAIKDTDYLNGTLTPVLKTTESSGNTSGSGTSGSSGSSGGSGNKHHSSSEESESSSSYTGMVLKDEPSGILASGNSVKSTSSLQITEIPESSFTNASAQKGSFYKGYDVSISGGFYDKLKVHFPVGQAMNGKTATILQEKADGSALVYSVVIADGYATIEVTELGKFAVFIGNVSIVTPAGVQIDPNARSPKTGEAVTEDSAIGAEVSDGAEEEASSIVSTVSITPEHTLNFALYGAILVVLLLAAGAVYYFIMKKSEYGDEE